MENDNLNTEPLRNRGSEALIKKYNINDQAHSDSSAEDFVKTVSEFHHADENDDQPQDDNQTHNL